MRGEEGRNKWGKVRDNGIKEECETDIYKMWGRKSNGKNEGGGKESNAI